MSPTHLELPAPKLTARRLAEYMAASPVRQRTLIRDTKYPNADGEISYQPGFELLGDMLADGDLATDTLRDAAEDFTDADSRGYRERLTHDLNSTMFDWLADHRPDYDLPGDRYDLSRSWGAPGAIFLAGVEIDPQVHLRLRGRAKRMDRVGVVTLRYAKGKTTRAEEAAWQAALLWGWLDATTADIDILRAARNLCIVLDLRSGAVHPAPSNTKTLMNQMQAACASIAERWPNIAPPNNAVIGSMTGDAPGGPAPNAQDAIPF